MIALGRILPLRGVLPFCVRSTPLRGGAGIAKRKKKKERQTETTTTTTKQTERKKKATHTKMFYSFRQI